ncbi:MAG TPA: hypothetical protein PKA00_11475 [Saprospiraceae bacterium]|nr:hypothetical protein [Saprospiraceae bacterium]HMQ83523.1 hypothetical protein [Saprospiraceae bacterium]
MESKKKKVFRDAQFVQPIESDQDNTKMNVVENEKSLVNNVNPMVLKVELITDDVIML